VDFTEESAGTEVPGFLAEQAAPRFTKASDCWITWLSMASFILGVITDLEAAESTEGDAGVVAPDNGRAGLVWKVSDNQRVAQICSLERDRWGVWAVSFPFKMTSRENDSDPDDLELVASLTPVATIRRRALLQCRTNGYEC